MKVRIVLFRGTDFISKWIRKNAQWMFSIPYEKTFSHVGFLFGDEIMEARPSKGVSIRNISELTEKVWIYEYAEEIESLHKLREVCNLELGKGYDFMGVLGFVYIFKPLANINRWFCSEFVIGMMRKCGVPVLGEAAAYKVSPTVLLLSTAWRLVYERDAQGRRAKDTEIGG